jgi:hypothetical protein
LLCRWFKWCRWRHLAMNEKLQICSSESKFQRAYSSLTTSRSRSGWFGTWYTCSYLESVNFVLYRVRRQYSSCLSNLISYYISSSFSCRSWNYLLFYSLLYW